VDYGNEFVCVDVETASSKPGTICQVGIARFCAGELVESRSWLVRPRSPFAPANTRLHGVTQAKVVGAATWEELYPHLARLLLGATVVSHTFFDRRSIFAACCRSALPMFSYRCWRDSCKLARQAWPEEDCYALPNLAKRFELAYIPHDAREDARVAVSSI
jgi:DNA polymerase-3 subunit epsilon